MPKQNNKEALAALREERKEFVDRARGIIKEQGKRMSAVKSQIETDARTIPEIAAALGMPTADIMVIVSGLRKYGEVVEAAKSGDYYTYQLAKVS